MILKEATIYLPDGSSLMDWMEALGRGAIAACVQKLPPALPSPNGRLPDQWARVVDASSVSAIVCFTRYSSARAGEEWEREEWHFQVPYTSTETGLTFGDAVQVELKMVSVAVPVVTGEREEAQPLEDEERIVEKAISSLKSTSGQLLAEALASAEKVLAATSGSSPEAAKLAVEISKARA